jgi:hypothetical protein
MANSAPELEQELLEAIGAADVEELFASPLSEEERRQLDDVLAKLPLAETACAQDDA